MRSMFKFKLIRDITGHIIVLCFIFIIHGAIALIGIQEYVYVAISSWAINRVAHW